MLKLAIIADDLTGANDSGVQLARSGLKTSVLMHMDPMGIKQQDAIVFDTDSRSVSQEEAYRRVSEVSEFIKCQGTDEIYKKMDSTMRGNIGVEIDAIFDAFHPDFVVIAPAYPKNGRQIMNGYHYLHDRLLHETEVSQDPKTPVKESYIPKLLQEQTARPIGLITCEELAADVSCLITKLEEYYHGKIPYIVFDSKRESDLERIVKIMGQTQYKIVWAGSAGLANYLAARIGRPETSHTFRISPNEQPVLLVVGSVSPKSRKQLEVVLADPNVEPVKLQSHLVVTDNATKQQEIDRVLEAAGKAIEAKQNVALYSSADYADTDKAMEAGRKAGLDATTVSNLISEALGRIAFHLVNKYDIRGIILTGGDTAKQVCTQLGAAEFELIDEVETGVPIGRLVGCKEMIAITKAGSFGTESTLLNSIRILRGEVSV